MTLPPLLMVKDHTFALLNFETLPFFRNSLFFRLSFGGKKLTDWVFSVCSTKLSHPMHLKCFDLQVSRKSVLTVVLRLQYKETQQLFDFLYFPNVVHSPVWSDLSLQTLPNFEVSINPTPPDKIFLNNSTKYFTLHHW